jgi:hypothetical protein
MPGDGYRGTASFAYHVHLDEVRPFLADRPATLPKAPSVAAPSPWPAGYLADFLDLDEDGIRETVVFGKREGEGLSGFLVDIKQISNRNFKLGDLNDPNQRKGFKFQFAYHVQPPRAFYATGKDGEIDLVLIPQPFGGGVSSAMRRTGDTWVTEDGKNFRNLIDPTLFPDKEMRDRFVKIITRLSR